MKLPTVYQRAEGAVIFLAATYLYFDQGFSLIWFAVLLCAFDVLMAGYLISNWFGAHLYNIGHSLILPTIVAVLYYVTGNDWLLGLACLWFAHIGIDRALGYGLKFTGGFKQTHLGVIGKN